MKQTDGMVGNPVSLWVLESSSGIFKMCINNIILDLIFIVIDSSSNSCPNILKIQAIKNVLHL